MELILQSVISVIHGIISNMIWQQISLTSTPSVLVLIIALASLFITGHFFMPAVKFMNKKLFCQKVFWDVRAFDAKEPLFLKRYNDKEKEKETKNYRKSLGVGSADDNKKNELHNKEEKAKKARYLQVSLYTHSKKTIGASNYTLFLPIKANDVHINSNQLYYKKLDSSYDGGNLKYDSDHPRKIVVTDDEIEFRMRDLEISNHREIIYEISIDNTAVIPDLENARLECVDKDTKKTSNKIFAKRFNTKKKEYEDKKFKDTGWAVLLCVVSLSILLVIGACAISAYNNNPFQFNYTSGNPETVSADKRVIMSSYDLLGYDRVIPSEKLYCVSVKILTNEALPPSSGDKDVDEIVKINGFNADEFIAYVTVKKKDGELDKRPCYLCGYNPMVTPQDSVSSSEDGKKILLYFALDAKRGEIPLELAYKESSISAITKNIKLKLNDEHAIYPQKEKSTPPFDDSDIERIVQAAENHAEVFDSELAIYSLAELTRENYSKLELSDDYRKRIARIYEYADRYRGRETLADSYKIIADGIDSKADEGFVKRATEYKDKSDALKKEIKDYVRQDYDSEEEIGVREEKIIDKAKDFNSTYGSADSKMILATAIYKFSRPQDNKLIADLCNSGGGKPKEYGYERAMGTLEKTRDFKRENNTLYELLKAYSKDNVGS